MFGTSEMPAIELTRFVEFGEDYFKHEPRRREDCVFETMTFRTEYIAWVRRVDDYSKMLGGDWSQIHVIDRGQTWVVDKPYEEIRELMFMACIPATPPVSSRPAR